MQIIYMIFLGIARIMHSLIYSYYSFGIDMEPDYQRDYVWGQEDKELLID